jgi:hypothetical protein
MLDKLTLQLILSIILSLERARKERIEYIESCSLIPLSANLSSRIYQSNNMKALVLKMGNIEYSEVANRSIENFCILKPTLYRLKNS